MSILARQAQHTAAPSCPADQMSAPLGAIVDSRNNTVPLILIRGFCIDKHQNPGSGDDGHSDTQAMTDTPTYSLHGTADQTLTHLGTGQRYILHKVLS